MKKTKTLEDKGGKPAPKIENAKHGSKAGLDHPRKAETKHAYTTGKKPKTEVTKHLETQPRSAHTDSSMSDQAALGHDEEFHPEDFNRFGTNFVNTSSVKKGM